MQKGLVENIKCYIFANRNKINTITNLFTEMLMKNFTLVMLSALTFNTITQAQVLNLKQNEPTLAPFTAQTDGTKKGKPNSCNVRNAKTTNAFEIFAPNRIKARARSRAAIQPIWVPRHEVVYERSYKGGDWYLSDDITNYYDTEGRNHGIMGKTTDETEKHPYYRQMTYYDEMGRKATVTDEVSDDGINFTPNFRYTYKYDSVVKDFVTKEECLMWNGKEYTDTIYGAGYKQTIIERDAQGRVTSALNFYMSGDYAEPELRARITVTYTDGQPDATSIKVEEQDYDYDTDSYVLMEKQTFGDLVWATTDNQYINADASFMQGDQRLNSSTLYYDGEEVGKVTAQYDNKNPEDYSYNYTTAAGINDFKVWTVDENGSYRYENRTTYIENDFQGSGWDLDSVIVDYDNHGYEVLYEKYLNSDIKVAAGDPAELQDGEKYTIWYNDKYAFPDSVLFTGWRYVPTDPDNPWSSEPKYVDLKMTKYSDFVDATTGVASSIAKTTTNADEVKLTHTPTGITVTATGVMNYRVYDATGRTFVTGTANGTLSLSNNALPKGVSIIQVSTIQGTKTFKVK